MALGFHGRPRLTGDLDLVVRPTAASAERIVAALAEFGFARLGLKPDDFTSPGQVIQLGIAPNRIDILTSLTGLTFDEIWAGRIEGRLDALPVLFLGRRELIRNKRATGRPQDLADLDALGAL
jgi:hypothetical protein